MSDVKQFEAIISSEVLSAAITSAIFNPKITPKPNLLIFVDENTWKSIQDFESQINGEESNILKDSWKNLKDSLRQYLQITLNPLAEDVPTGEIETRYLRLMSATPWGSSRWP
jgi:hypothetical protein